MKELHLTWEIANSLFIIHEGAHDAMRDYMLGSAEANEVEHEVQRLESWLASYRELNPKPDQ